MSQSHPERILGNGFAGSLRNTRDVPTGTSYNLTVVLLGQSSVRLPLLLRRLSVQRLPLSGGESIYLKCMGIGNRCKVWWLP